MQKWEYKTIYRTWKQIGEKREFVWSDADMIAHATDSLEKRLEELGAFGWELAGIEPVIKFSEDGQKVIGIESHYYFKHPIK